MTSWLGEIFLLRLESACNIPDSLLNLSHPRNVNLRGNWVTVRRSWKVSRWADDKEGLDDGGVIDSILALTTT